MGKLLSSTLNARRILRQNGLKRGMFRIETEVVKNKAGKEYRDTFIYLKIPVIEETILGIINDGLTLFVPGKFPIFKY